MSQFRPTLRPESESLVNALLEQVLSLHGLNEHDMPKTAAWHKFLSASVKIHNELPEAKLREFYS